MDSKGKIGVIIPAVYDMLDLELLDGISRQAEYLGYDTVVFAGITDDCSESYKRGQENIYRLAEIAKLDGIVFAACKFADQKLKARIYDELSGLNLPIVSVSDENSFFPSINAEQRRSIKRITEHLITVHGCKTIYCLTGPKGNAEAEERLMGYREAMRESGNEPPKDWIFYGDFWWNSAKELAEKIVMGEISVPDALVCTSDIMAIAFSDAIKKAEGFHSKIAVTGYDGSIYSLISEPSVTTTSGRNLCLGNNAVCELVGLISGKKPEPLMTEQNFLIGESCGCKRGAEYDKILLDYAQKAVTRRLSRRPSIASNHIAMLSDVESFKQLAVTIDSLVYMLWGSSDVNVCLCEDWARTFDENSSYRKSDFSDNMLMMYSRGLNGQYSFPTEMLLPRLNKRHKPSFTVFTSLHFNDQILGYVAGSYESIRDFDMDEHYVNWCDAVSNGLNILQNREYDKKIRSMLESKTMTDLSTGFRNSTGFFGELNGSENVLLIAYPKADLTPIVAYAVRAVCKNDEVVGKLDENVIAIIKSENTETILFELKQTLCALRSGAENDIITDIVENADKAEAEKRICELKKCFLGSPNDISSDYYNTLLSIRREIKYSPEDEQSVLAIARKAGLSKSHFQRLYKLYFNTTCIDDIISARLEKAKQLLINTKMSVGEIAAVCGYQNASHFMRQFKQHEKVSATEFRKSNK